MNSPASLAELARCVKVVETGQIDRLELVSAWQRLPERSLNRLFAWLLLGIVVLLVLALLLQGILTLQPVALVLAVAIAALAIWQLWRVRYWFWRTVYSVDASTVALQYHGWAVPEGMVLQLADISALQYRLHNGQLDGLFLAHRDGNIPLPFSGRKELDKLYCNLLKHLLQKHQSGIVFRQMAEVATPAASSSNL